MNSIKLSGRPTKEPEIRSYVKADENGNDVDRKVVSFTLAVDIVAGRKREEALFIRCVGFGKIAEIIEKNVSKGDKVIIEGWLSPNNYKKNDVDIYSFEVVIDDVEFCFSSERKNEESDKEINSESEDGFVEIPEEEAGELPMPY